MKSTPFLLLFLLFVGNINAQEVKYQTSTYDNPKFTANVESQRETFDNLEKNGLFSMIHNKLILGVNEKSKKYFTDHTEYELLYSVKGDIFLNQKEDMVFIVFDKQNVKINILLFNALENTYSLLYKDIKVEDGLENADCDYFNFGTLDFQIASNIYLFENSLTKNPNGFFEYNLCKIGNIYKNEKLILKKGCFSKKYKNQQFLHSNALCFATSLVYNNWDCMIYDKNRKVFVICYGQAFSD